MSTWIEVEGGGRLNAAQVVMMYTEEVSTVSTNSVVIFALLPSGMRTRVRAFESLAEAQKSLEQLVDTLTGVTSTTVVAKPGAAFPGVDQHRLKLRVDYQAEAGFLW